MPLPRLFKDQCVSLVNSPLKLICSGEVAAQHCRQHKCPEDPYSIFQLESQNSSYLVFFRSLEIRKCRSIELLDRHNVLCVNHQNKPKNLFFGFSHLVCHSRSMQLTADLRENCGGRGYEPDLLSGYYYANEETNPSISLFESRDTGCGLLGSPILVLCLLISLFLVLCLRWR
ncbi:uncharacterized protein [Drosophila kikkawai]|uniref:Uncharacterized protein n=1 Tax=Drosophila kikkawai TaxID=30033 RepID=A0A6P4I4N8_DROKI|nr:uncharacterized protein LOC108072280 [Drosophila kikkawai]